MKRSIYLRKKYPPQRELLYEEAFHRSQQALRQFIQTVPVAICILDRQNRVYLDVNDRFAELVGLPRQEILYRRDDALAVGLGENNIQRIFASLERPAPVRNLEMKVFNQSGKLIRGMARVDAVDYSGRECVLVTFSQAVREDTQPRPSSHESKLAAAGEAGKSLAEILDPDEIYRRLAAAVYRILPDVCSVYISMYDTSLQQIVCVYGEHEGDPFNPAEIPPLPFEQPGKGLQSEVIRSGKPAVVEDYLQREVSTQPSLRYSRPGLATRSGVYVPMVSKGSVIGLVQARSYKPGRFTQTDASLLSLVANTAAIAIQNSRLAQTLEKTTTVLTQTYEATIDGWTRALELRDFTTERHTHRVVTLTLALSQKLGLDSKDLLTVRRGAQLHDIGKMGIPDTILLKPGPLDESEWRIMRRHPVYAYELLRPIPHFGEIIDIPYCHHEKWDGSGYPRRLRGEEIPLSARIFSIVDVWDALSSHRPYRPAWPPNQVVDYIRYQSNKHFEPEVTRAFLDLMRGNGSPLPSKPARPVSNPPPSFQAL